MSEMLTNAEWQAEQLRRQRKRSDDFETRMELNAQLNLEYARLALESTKLQLAQMRRANRRVLGIIPGYVWDTLPGVALACLLFGIGMLMCAVLLHATSTACGK